MVCSRCGAQTPQGANFCPTCGGPSERSTVQTVTNSGDRSGPVIQVGGDFHAVVAARNEPATTEYVTKSYRASPLTQTVLAWISVVLGIISVLSGWWAMAPPVQAIVEGSFSAGALASAGGAFSVFFVAVVLAFLAISGTIIASRRTQHLSRFSFLPALTGKDGRLGLARFEGTCTICGGKLRFYSKPLEWVENLDTGKRRITRRGLAGECRRNREHWWAIDSTDTA